MSTFAKKSFDAAAYAASRPSYPPALYHHVLSYAKNTSSPSTVLDIGCGPGISTYGLDRFDHVIGVDPSQGMCNVARDILKQKVERGEISQGKVRFEQGSGEDLSRVVDSGTIDLVVAGQAAHWFDAERVYGELRRILKPGGAFVFWCYGEFFLPDHPRVNKLIPQYSAGKLGPYWQQPGRSIAESLLCPFPFPSEPSASSKPDFDRSSFHRSFFLRSESASPPPTSDPDYVTTSKHPLLLKHDWTLKQIEAYLRTWSSAATFKERHPKNPDPVDEMVEKLRNEGGLKDDVKVEVGWEVGMIMGRMQSS